MYFLFRQKNPRKGCPVDLDPAIAERFYPSTHALGSYLDSIPQSEIGDRFWWQSGSEVRENLNCKMPDPVWVMTKKRNLRFDYYQDGAMFLSDEFLKIIDNILPDAILTTPLILVDFKGQPVTENTYRYAHSKYAGNVLSPAMLAKLSGDMEKPQTAVCLADYVEDSNQIPFEFMEVMDIDGIFVHVISDRIYEALKNGNMLGLNCVPPDEIWMANYTMIGDDPFDLPPHPRRGNSWSDDLPRLYS